MSFTEKIANWGLGSRVYGTLEEKVNNRTMNPKED